MLTPQFWRADCAPGGNGLIVYSPDGTRYDMTNLVNVGTGLNPMYAWYATKITDKNGNYADITYGSGTANVEVQSVTTSDGRTLTFNYADSGTWGRRITSIVGPNGTTTYNYQDAGGGLLISTQT